MAVKKHSHFKKSPLFLKNNKGLAVVEMLFLLPLFVVLFGLTFGFWTAIHRGSLQSIAARHYAFEVLNYRSDINYHRDVCLLERDCPNEGSAPESKSNSYKKAGYRFFAVVKQQPENNTKLKARKQKLSLFDKGFGSIPKEKDNRKVNPLELKTGYGICVSCRCGGIGESCQ